MTSVAGVPLSKLCAHVVAGARGAASVALAHPLHPRLHEHWLALTSDVSARTTNSEMLEICFSLKKSLFFLSDNMTERKKKDDGWTAGS